MGEDQEGHPKTGTGDYFHFVRVQALSGQGLAGSALTPRRACACHWGTSLCPSLSLEAGLRFSSLLLS